jgi:hypothetical protein
MGVQRLASIIPVLALFPANSLTARHSEGIGFGSRSAPNKLMSLSPSWGV